jgi:hypothetical protein
MSQQRDATRLSVKVVPGASKSQVVGWLGKDLKIRVTKPAEKGKANREAEALICEMLSIPAGSARIVSGNSSARKVLAISGISNAELQIRLRAIAPERPS